MGTRRVQFFMMPEELSEFLRTDLASMALEMINSPDVAEPIYRLAFIAPRGTQPLPSDLVLPARDGWLVLTPPTVTEGKLYLAEIAGKSEWDDPDTNFTTSNPDVERLFRRVARRLRPRLTFSVRATNVVTGKSAIYKTIGYSEGARRWLEESGEWMQEGVNNVRYDLQMM
jgi:hypothetical protein